MIELQLQNNRLQEEFEAENFDLKNKVGLSFVMHKQVINNEYDTIIKNNIKMLKSADTDGTVSARPVNLFFVLSPS